MNRHLSLALAAACALALGAPASAFAQEAAQVRQRVPSGDLNLRSAAGRATLNQRVRGAADAVCDTGDSKDLASIAETNRCRHAAMRNGQAQASSLASRQEEAARAERAAAARRAVARVEAKRRRTHHRIEHHLRRHPETHTARPLKHP